MAQPEPTLVHPAISAIATTAVSRLGGDVSHVDQSGPVPADVQRTTLLRLRELGGPSEVLLAGVRFQHLQDYPLFLVLLNSDSVPVVLEKASQLNRYFHSHHRHQLRELGQRGVELDHVSMRGPAPEAVESLFVAGIYLAVLDQVGCEGLRVAFPLSDQDGWAYRSGEATEVPGVGTGRWRFEWDRFTATRALPGLDRLLLEDPGSDLEQTSVSGRVVVLVDRDLSRHWRLSEIAGELMVSPRTLQRRLHDEGTSLTEIVAGRRLASARDLLVETTHSVTDIGYMLGYSDTSHFTRTFAAAMGLPPSRWRERRAASS